jgi:TonB family protein
MQEASMMKRSWFYRNGLFFTLLALVLLIHMILLAVRIHREMQLTQSDDKEVPLKVKIIDELRKDKKQIVQSDDPPSDEVPIEDSFLSDRNRKFDRQSRAEKIAPFKKPAPGGETKSAKELQLSDLGAYDQGHDPFKKSAQDKTAKKQGQEDSEQTDPSMSSTNDYLEEVPLGDLTYLNTVEYKYYGFYHRIRQKLEQFWGRSIQETATTLVQSGRHLAVDDDLITALEVTLNAHGEIIAIKIKGSSGIKELDDAAIESFNQAGPFPNPPKDLMVNGSVKIEWGFVVST